MEELTFLQMFSEASKMGNYSLVAACVIMLVVTVLRKTWLKQIKNHAWFPWISVGISLAGVAATNVIAGQNWLSACLNAVTIGVTASGFWSLLGKYLFKEKE